MAREEDVRSAEQQAAEAYQALRALEATGGRDPDGRLMPLRPLSEELERRMEKVLEATQEWRTTLGNQNYVDQYGKTVTPAHLERAERDAQRALDSQRQANARAEEANWRDLR